MYAFAVFYLARVRNSVDAQMRLLKFYTHAFMRRRRLEFVFTLQHSAACQPACLFVHKLLKKPRVEEGALLSRLMVLEWQGCFECVGDLLILFALQRNCERPRSPNFIATCWSKEIAIVTVLPDSSPWRLVEP